MKRISIRVWIKTWFYIYNTYIYVLLNEISERLAYNNSTHLRDPSCTRRFFARARRAITQIRPTIDNELRVNTVAAWLSKQIN